MRKKPFSQTSLNCHHRITPARAGKTVCPPVEGTTAEDHPRSCGKDVCKPLLRSAKRGSPPLVRERPCCRFRRIHCPRIPPRSCGKDCRPFGMLLLPSGSPPLVRERLPTVWHVAFTVGITPARAGKTAAVAKSGKYSEDHPRSCGKVVLAYK